MKYKLSYDPKTRSIKILWSELKVFNFEHMDDYDSKTAFATSDGEGAGLDKSINHSDGTIKMYVYIPPRRECPEGGMYVSDGHEPKEYMSAIREGIRGWYNLNKNRLT